MRRGVIAVGSVVGIAAAAVAYLAFLHSPRLGADRQWAVFGKYCVECHNRDDLTANIAFDKMSKDSVAKEPQVFEAVVRKLRGAMMPPPGWPQPQADRRESLVSWLETTLDAAAVKRRTPAVSRCTG